jgi:DsbC/DsbD-like thiol-disulfide interchange protein/cytochrome c biogenesis protein CcdA
MLIWHETLSVDLQPKEARLFAAPRLASAAWTKVLLSLFAALSLASLAGAQEQAREARYGDQNIAVELFADGMPRAGEEWMLALRFRPRGPEWHGYWSNPGDAGLGMDLTLDLPDGWEAGEPLYPVPERLTIAGLMNHIYEGNYTVLVPISVPADATIDGVPDITGFIEYLACTDEICVPQDAALRAGQTGDFARWRAELAPLLDAKATYSFTNDRLRLAIPLPESVALREPHVFLSQTRLVDYGAAQTFSRDGDRLIVEIPLDEFGSGEAEIVSGILAFDEEIGVRFKGVAGDVPPLGEIMAGPVGGGNVPPFWTLILGALIGGLILNVMPCVFPILSLKALSLVRAGGGESQARREGLSYTAGVVLACMALGAIMLALRAAGEQVGWAFQLQEPAVVFALLVLASVITANFAGLFELPGVAIGGARLESRGAGGAFATGLLAAIAATPCTGPFMAAALGAALLLPAGLALLLFAMLGLGLALPFLALGFVPALRRRLPRPGAWMERFRRLMAIPMGLTALALVWLTAQLGGRGFALFALVTIFGIVLALAIVGRLQRKGQMAWPAFALIAAPFLVFGGVALPSSYAAQSPDVRASLLAAEPFSRAALAEARASGQPVFVWFTADWCVTCKVNESVAIEREATARAFEEAGVVALVGDWTRRDEAIASFLADQGVAGVPLYLWYEPGNAGETLPQVLAPDALVSRAKQTR